MKKHLPSRGQAMLETLLILSGTTLVVLVGLALLRDGLNQCWAQLSITFFLPSP